MDIQQAARWITRAVGGLVGGVVGLLGGADQLLTALLVLIALDYASAIARSVYQSKLSSEMSAKGIAKKFMYFVVIAVSVQIGKVVQAPALADVVIGLYVFTEAVSIVENAAATGLPIPKVLKDALAQLNPDKTTETK